MNAPATPLQTMRRHEAEVRALVTGWCPSADPLVGEALGLLELELRRSARERATAAFLLETAEVPGLVAWAASRVLDQLVAAACSVFHDQLLLDLRRGYPREPLQLLEDAVQVTCEEVLRREDAVFAVLSVNGPGGVYGYMRTIAWRTVWQVRHRGPERREVCLDSVPERSAPPTELPRLKREAEEEVRRVLAAAAGAMGHGRTEALFLALVEHIFEGVSGVEVARRHGLPREYVSKARSWIRRNRPG